MKYVFDKGLDQATDPEKTVGLQEAYDVAMEQAGSMRAVRTDKLGTAYGAAVHSIIFGGLSTWDPLLIGVGTDIRIGQNVIKSGFSGRDWEYTSQGGKLYMTNDSDGLWYYDGAKLWREGAPAPDSTGMAGAAGGGTGFTGNYNFKVTFVNRNGEEGNASEAITVAGLVNEDVNLTGIPVNTNSEYDIIYRKVYIYAGTTPAYGDYQLCGTILDNVTTTLNVATTDVASDVLAIDNNTPPVGDFVFSHYNVLWTGTGNGLRISKAGHPGQWPATQEYTVSRSGDSMMMGIAGQGVAYVVTRMKVFEVIGAPGGGDLVVNFYPKETGASKGTIAKRSVAMTPYGLIFQTEDGIGLFNGSTLDPGFGEGCKGELDGRNTNDTAESLSVGEFIDDKYILSFCHGSSTVPNRSVVYDFKKKLWTASARGYRVMAADRRNNVMWVGTGNDLKVWRDGPMYSAWSVKKEFGGGAYTNWGVIEPDMNGSGTVEVYSDDDLEATYTVTSTTRGLTQRKRSPARVSSRVAVRFSGVEKATQDVLYGFSVGKEA